MLKGKIQSLFNKEYVPEVYGIEGHAIYMKYYEDGSLRSQIDKGGADRARYFCAYNIIKGIQEIHRLNFVHSDIKASNILVNKMGSFLTCFISDFGAARLKVKTILADSIYPWVYPIQFFLKSLFVLKMIFSF